MSGAEAENDRRQWESCVLIKAKLPTLMLAGWKHIASAANNVRLPTKRVATEPQQPGHGPSGPRHMGNSGLLRLRHKPNGGQAHAVISGKNSQTFNLSNAASSLGVCNL